ncbi:MAG TPA: DDE transposase, partial [Planctomycetes bacterium]|nr:DDE transposase [Planctomycetota bacterium]
MHVSIQTPLFPRDELQDHPALVTIEELLATIPDAELLEGLRQARGRGRDDYPVRVLWGVVVLTAV